MQHKQWAGQLLSLAACDSRHQCAARTFVGPHGDGNQRVLIIPNVCYPAVPYASCFAPSCVPSKVSRVLLGGWPVGRPQSFRALRLSLGTFATSCSALQTRSRPWQPRGTRWPTSKRAWMDPSHASLSFAPHHAPPPPGVQPPHFKIKIPNERPPLAVNFGPTPKTFRSGYQRHVRSVYLSVRKIVAGPQAQFATSTT